MTGLCAVFDMSEPITDLVWGQPDLLDHDPLLLMLALASQVELRRQYNDFYEVPTSVVDLMAMCRMSRSRVLRILEQLSEEGWLEMLGEQPKKTSARWTARLNLKKLSTEPMTEAS